MTINTPNNANGARVFLLLASLLAAGAAGAAPTLLAPQAGDLRAAAVVAPLTALKSAGLATTRREAVSLSWATQGDVTPAGTPFVAKSQEYYTEVSADELAAGVAIHTTSPRAVVRIAPRNAAGPRESLAIHPLSLVINDARGRAFAAGAGMEQLVSADKLAKADMPFAPGTSAFRLHPDLGAGAFTLKTDGLQGSERYLINVIEPDSALALTMQTDAPHYLHGQQLVILPELVEQAGVGAAQRHPLTKLDGYVTSPAGRNFPVVFKTGADGRLRARLTLDADEAPTPGLWEVHAQASATVKGQAVLRSVRLAFGVAMPVARLAGTAAMANTAGNTGVRLGVDVGTAGRYEARALLYGMVKGAMAPIGVAQAAQWMEPGHNDIVLSYAADLVEGAAAPFELRDLSLLDQGRMGLLERQQRAVVLEERDIVRGAGKAGIAGQAALAGQTLKVKLPPNTEL